MAPLCITLQAIINSSLGPRGQKTSDSRRNTDAVWHNNNQLFKRVVEDYANSKGLKIVQESVTDEVHEDGVKREQGFLCAFEPQSKPNAKGGRFICTSKHKALEALFKWILKKYTCDPNIIEYAQRQDYDLYISLIRRGFAFHFKNKADEEVDGAIGEGSTVEEASERLFDWVKEQNSNS